MIDEETHQAVGQFFIQISSTDRDPIPDMGHTCRVLSADKNLELVKLWFVTLTGLSNE